MGRNFFVIKPFLLLITSFLMGWCAWNIPQFSLILFVALVPLFFFFEKMQQTRLSRWYIYLLSVFIFKFLWVAGQVYWLKEVTYDTFLASIVTHSLIFSIVQLPAIISFSKTKSQNSFVLFILGWVLYEYLMQNFSLLSPFYILGSALGDYPIVIQNYSVIGIEGGTLWVLLVNYFLFRLVSGFKQKNQLKKRVVSLVLVVFAPFLLSVVMLFSHESSSIEKMKVAALHTDFNPVNNYYGTHPDVIIDSLWNLSKRVDESTEVLLWPETVVTNLGWMQELQQNIYIDSLQKKIERFASLNLIFGANIHTIPVDNSDERLNYSKEYDFYFYVHNMAFSLNSGNAINYRGKEIFVPFQEEVPYVRTFPFLKKLITVVGNPNFYSEYENDLDVHRTVKGVDYVPLLCYEICYPLFTSKVSKDIGFIALLGNEHWNTSKKGSRIYFNILRAMAVQNQIPIVKSSNNGISVICGQSGEIIAKKSFDDTGLLKGEICLKERNSFYSYISGYSYLISLVLYAYFLIRKKKKTTP
jgi:apolipoprotein N-acyltransferase